ncbi:MAG TPA: T9SS type A sorting domain-containing protein [Bacteroidales bacterium]|nr:T9SS type A sorting domain-containing protein [Bacteroidales bacterium]
MKKCLLLVLIMATGVLSFAQYQKAALPRSVRNIAVPKKCAVTETTNPFTAEANNYVESSEYYMEEEAGYTVYDLQSNGSTPYGRLTQFDDGTMAAVYTMAINPTAYNDRGTGYNYFDGTTFGPSHVTRLESVKSGWPSHAQLGANGEVIVSHRNGTSGLNLLKRNVKGTGEWTESDIAAPAGAAGLLWPRMVTGGTDKNTIHIIVLTSPTANGGTAYNGQDGALLYMRSQDGGATWDKSEVLPGLGSELYSGFSGDNYSFAEPRGNTLAFVVTDDSQDLILMKSTDNGESWTKTIIWARPYAAITAGADSMYSQDGGGHPVIDVNGKVHLFFGVYRTNPAEGTWYPYIGSIAYWNEDMPTWTGGTDEYQLNCLNPDTLDLTGQLVAYPLDLNGDGLWNVLGEAGLYYCSPIGMPQALIDDDGDGFLIFSAITEGFDNDAQDYRHLWGRAIYNYGDDFGCFFDLTGDDIHMFDECVFPSICATGDLLEGYKIMYQLDTEPGLSVRGDEDQPGDNYLNIQHLVFPTGTEKPVQKALTVSQNLPNPFSGTTEVKVYLEKQAPVNIVVTNVSGQQVSNINCGTLGTGIHTLTIDASNLSAGVYFYTVNNGASTSTHKMIVK